VHQRVEKVVQGYNLHQVNVRITIAEIQRSAAEWRRLNLYSHLPRNMTVHGIGIDLLHIPRMVALTERRGPSRLASRILSPSELRDFRRLKSDKLAENGQGSMEAGIRFLGVRYASLSCTSLYSDVCRTSILHALDCGMIDGL
jgi:hypothetical protein